MATRTTCPECGSNDTELEFHVERDESESIGCGGCFWQGAGLLLVVAFVEWCVSRVAGLIVLACGIVYLMFFAKKSETKYVDKHHKCRECGATWTETIVASHKNYD